MWQFQKTNLTLNLDGYYEIDLERCNTSAEILDWIIQIAKKTWATDDVLTDLVRQLDLLLDIQENVCPCGVDRKFTAKKYLLSKEGRLHRYLTGARLDEYLKKYQNNPTDVNVIAYEKARKAALREMPADY